MKKVLIMALCILLFIATDSVAQYKYRANGGSSTVTDADADTAADAANLAYYMKSVASTGKISITGPAAGSTRAKTVRDADDTVIESGGTYTPTFTMDLAGATFTNYPWQLYNQYYMKKSSAALSTGFVTCTDENGDLYSCGEKVDLSSPINENVETSGYLSGRMRAVIVAVPSGVHDGSDDAALLTDGGIDIGADALIGMTVYNVTDGSSCTITDNAATTITCTLAGGTDNNWDANDVWQVGPGPAQSGSVFYVGSAGVIRHPATAGYLAGYYATAAAVITVDVAATMQIATITNAAGDSIDSAGAAENYIWLHNVSATSARQHGKSGTWTDGD